MNIYTYYDPVLKDQDEIIKLWEETWRNNGWNPLRLSAADCDVTKQELIYFETLPTVNPRKYTLACWLRWNAMSLKGGWMCDYDVVNCGFTPKDAMQYKSLSILQNFIPCLVYGSKEHYRMVYDIFKTRSKEYTVKMPQGKHVEDMMVTKELIHSEPHISAFNIVEYYPTRAKLVHCSHKQCESNSVSKLGAMKHMLNN